MFGLVFGVHLLKGFLLCNCWQSTGTRRLQRLRLVLRSFVLDRLRSPDVHYRLIICAVECVTSHLRESADSRSEVVFCIEGGQVSLGTTCRRRHPMGLPTTLGEYVVERHQRDHNRVFTKIGDAGTHSVRYGHFRVPAFDQRKSHNLSE